METTGPYPDNEVTWGVLTETESLGLEFYEHRLQLIIIIKAIPR